jgi:hypothetical protein
MKITKILVALSFLFSVATANSGELTVTGNMEATYNSQGGNVTGNPLGTDRELKFSGSTELDNGVTVTVMQDTSDALGYGDNLITFGNVMGMVDIYVGADGGPVDAIDDITPSAYEEAWGSGAGTINDIGTGVAGQMGIGLKATIPYLGAVNFKYVPKADSTENADNANSGTAGNSVGSGESITIKTNLGDLPGAGALAGLVVTTGYESVETSSVANTADSNDATVAVNYTIGQFALGVQKKVHNEGETSVAADEIFYKDMVYGVSYAVNDALSISYNRYDSYRHNNALGTNAGNEDDEQSITAFNVGYTVGGMTIGLQDASTDNAGWVKDAEDDSRTLGISVAF